MIRLDWILVSIFYLCNTEFKPRTKDIVITTIQVSLALSPFSSFFTYYTSLQQILSWPI